MSSFNDSPSINKGYWWYPKNEGNNLGYSPSDTTRGFAPGIKPTAPIYSNGMWSKTKITEPDMVNLKKSEVAERRHERLNKK